jgi:single-stranded-DNA-specific exonuclease
MVALLPLGVGINYYLPHREKEGYGLSCSVVEKAKKFNYSLLITVDNGISAHKPAQRARELGLDLIITDHHRPHAQLPPALAVIDPNQDDCQYPYKKLAGVGVTFKIVSFIYEKLGKPLPQKVYELLMLGTVADVVPLTQENRFWVRYGLSKTNKQKSLSMSVLGANSKLSKNRWSSLDIGFMIAPQINALGRLTDPREAVKFLISSNKDDVVRVGKILKEMNDERKRVERRIYDEIDGVIINKEIDLDKENIIVAASSRWPSGVIGLVAGRLMHNYGKPTFLFHERRDGTLRGSCRSIPEFDIFSALQENSDLLLTFGGHSFAAGLSLKKENIEEFKSRLEEKVAKELDPEVLQPRIELDANCMLSDMTSKLLHDLEQLEPFGNSNLQPTFLVDNVTLVNQPTLLKEKHVKCSVFSDGVVKPVIFFNRPDLFPIFNSIGEQSFSMAGHILKNEWNDRVRIEFQGLDISIS